MLRLRSASFADLEHRGRIKFWLAERNFGFIEPDAGGDDVFVHSSVLVEDCAPMKGDAVLFSVGMRKGKYGATAVRVL